MNFNLFLLALRARFTLFAVVLGFTVVAASAASLLLPKSYQATASLLVDAKDEQSLGASMRPLVQPPRDGQLSANTDGHHHQRESGAQRD